MPRYMSLDNYQDLWNTMKISPGRACQFVIDAKKIISYRDRFENVVKQAGGNVPWYFLAVIYFREDGCNFKGHVHNGDSLKLKTVRTPVGRPVEPPANPVSYSFEESAIDFIHWRGYDKMRSWILPMMLYKLEENNGFGYWNRKINTPYLWSGTNHYASGYFINEHRFDPDAVNRSSGAAPLIRYLTDKTLGLVD